MMKNTAAGEVKLIFSPKVFHLSSAKNSLSRVLSANRQVLVRFKPIYLVLPWQ
jgi:hypothetical protein